MAWTSTVDERYAGTYLTYTAGTYDAPYLTTTPYKLAARSFAYGALIPASYTKDKDAYSLGILSPGVYAIFASGDNWDFSNFIFGSSPTAINLHDYSGSVILTSTLGSLYFTVSQAGTFYVSIEGNNYLSSEYSLVYTPNYNGNVNIDINGTKSVGSILNADYTVIDLNGATSISPSYQWAVSIDGTSWSVISGATTSSYKVQASDAGKYLRVGFSYTDNEGFLESFVSIATTKITPDTVKPTLFETYPIINSKLAISQNIALYFSEEIKRGTGLIKIEKKDGTSVENFEISNSNNIYISGTSLIINPTKDLNYDTEYILKIENSAITDNSGNTYNQASAINFISVSPPSIATPSPSSIELSNDNLIDAMTNGYKWILSSNKTIDWSISNGFSQEYWTNPDSVAEHIKAALSIYSYYADIKFNFLGHFSDPATAAKYGSDINISMDAGSEISSFSNNSVWAVGFFPDAAQDSNQNYYTGVSGDIYLNINSQANYLTSYEPGSAGWSLIIHELGHTLGLKHPHDDGGTGRPTFSEIGFSDLNIDFATIMSYNDDADFNLLSWDPATPMILDVLALQYLYGKNENSNTGDTIFDLNETDYYITLYDSSGIDKLNAENATEAWTIILPNISLTTLVNTKVGFAVPTSELVNTPKSLHWVAGDIENVTGTKFNDNISGNNLNNTIDSGNGNDTIKGSDGSDILIGNIGTDIFELSSQKSNYQVQYTKISSFNGYVDGFKVTSISNKNNQSLLLDFEKIKFSDGTYLLNEIAPPDNTSPKVSSLQPANEASAVASTSNIIVTFDEKIQRGAENIVLKTSEGAVIATYTQTSSNISIYENTLTIDPTYDLNYGTVYKVEFSSGSVQDLAGNDYVGTTSYNFKTNTLPVPSSITTTTNEDSAKSGTLSGSDAESSSLTFSKVADPSNGTVTVDSATGAYTYTPAANFNGSDSFTFKVNDGTVDSAAATVSITVTAVNDAPVATAATATTNEDSAKSGTLSGSDAESSSLTFSKVADPSNGTVTVDSATGAYTYTPAANFNGSDSFTFKVNDGTVDSAAATVSITVTAVNDAPVATAATATTNEDSAKSGTLSGSDAESSSLTFSKVADPSNGTVTVDSATGAYTYTPAANFNGSDSFTFKVNDGTVDSAAATVSITVTAVNDAPVATAATATTNEDSAKSGTLSGSDAESSSLTFSKVADPSNGTVTVDSATGAYTYTPAANFNGSDSFTFKVNDGTVDSAAATVSITVTAVNDAPVATAATATTNEDSAKSGTLSGTDVDGNTLTYNKVTEPTNGSVNINATTGAYTYTPAANFNGSDSFTFKVNDGTVDSAAATVSITVEPSRTAFAKFWNNTLITPTETNIAAAIDLGDAISILKMIVGLNVNGNAIPLSPYQALAADFNQNGDVGLDDAIGVLKKIVGLNSAEPIWKYFDDAKVQTSLSNAESLSPKSWIGDAEIFDLLSTHNSINVIGVLTGDVNGNWI